MKNREKKGWRHLLKHNLLFFYAGNFQKVHMEIMDLYNWDDDEKCGS